MLDVQLFLKDEGIDISSDEKQKKAFNKLLEEL
jgi:hypothetical protein